MENEKEGILNTNEKCNYVKTDSQGMDEDCSNSNDDDVVVIVSDIDPIDVPLSENCTIENDFQLGMTIFKSGDESSNFSLDSNHSTESFSEKCFIKNEHGMETAEYESDWKVPILDTESASTVYQISKRHKEKSRNTRKYSVYQNLTKKSQKSTITDRSRQQKVFCQQNVKSCTFKSRNANALTGHSVIHNNATVYKCEKCDFECGGKVILNIHSAIHTDSAPYDCGSKRLSSLKGDRTEIHSDKELSCDSLPRHLKRHSVMHTTEKLFVCDICGFTSTRDLRIHRLSHSKVKSHSCDECGVKLKSLNNLKRHKTIHNDEKPFSCNLCNFRCKAAGNLKIHKLTHYEDAPFCCNQCSFKCKNSSNLNAHMIVHTEDRRFACDVCEFRCKRLCHLKEHKALHSDARPFICDICGFKCKRLSYLRTHQMTHEDVSPYACDLCSFRSKRAGNLKAHRLTHSGGERLTCDKCDYKCRLTKDLNRHKKDHDKTC